MKGKRILITGATNGIGKQAALELARMGADIVIVGRDENKTRRVMQEIKSNGGSAEVDMLVADLSSFAEVRRIAEEFRAQFSRLDVLLNNAGASFTEYYRSADGFEMTFALNHCSYYLLTNLLLDILQVTAREHGDARIVNVSSSAHSAAPREGWQPADARDAARFRPFPSYGKSKLANLLFTYELARRLEGSAITVNALHPGVVNTGFGDNMNGFMRYFFMLMKNLIGRSPAKGAETLVYLASSPAVAGISSAYWSDKKQKRSSDISYDRAQQQQLWDFSAEITGVG